MLKMLPSVQLTLCGGCGEEIKEHPKRCARCWCVHALGGTGWVVFWWKGGTALVVLLT